MSTDRRPVDTYREAVEAELREETATPPAPAAELVVVNPATGETLDLKTATTTTIADAILDLDELERRLADFRQDLVDEVAGRMDRMNTRNEELDAGGAVYVIKTNAPTSESYTPAVLEAALLELVKDELLDPALVERVVPHKTPPKFTPGRKVALAEVNKLKKSTEPRVLAAIGRARDVVHNARTITVERKERKA